MFMGAKADNSAHSLISSGLVTAVLLGTLVGAGALAQAPDPSAVAPSEPTSIALPLPEDRGASALEQALRRLHTTASVMMIVAHPDDEDGPLLTYLSRGLGARCTLFTLTRGEGGQNVMSADTYDALGLIRTNELLEADRYYGVKQLWGTEADFGFSKTQQEAFSRWGHDRVLYDAVLAVRRERPQVIVATFVGAVSDGHGQHQVSGEIAQEVFKAAGDPKVFPEQLKDGLQPWQPLAVYGMVPFAPINEKGMMFDYATGKWAPAEFKNYVTGETLKGAPSTDATIAVGNRDSLLGRSYTQIARQGWGEQRSQNGGANPTLSDPGTANYHLWAVAPAAASGAIKGSGDLFHNSKVSIDTTVAALAHLAGPNPPSWLSADLQKLSASLAKFDSDRNGKTGSESGHLLAPIYGATIQLRKRVQDDTAIRAEAKASLLFELDAKLVDFQAALKELLGIDVVAFRTKESRVQGGGFRGNSADEMSDSVSPGEDFNVRVHTAASSSEVRVSKISFEMESGSTWQQGEALSTSGTAPYSDAIFKLKVPDSAQPTQPFFTRPSIEQPYYNVSNEAWRERSFAPWPVSAGVEFTFDGVPIRVAETVQTLQRVTGHGGYYQPLIVSPAIGVSVTPEARILPLDGGALPVKVTVHTQAAASGTVTLSLPRDWQADPAEAKFNRTAAGDTEPIVFSVRPIDGHANADGTFDVKAIAHSGGHDYESGWRSVGYPGLRPYNMYRGADFRTRRVDVKLAPGLRIGYVMGPGDLVPEAIEAMGIMPHLLSTAELTSADLSAWNVIVVGIRAYSTVPELTAAQPRLDEYVRNGGTLIVQYQSATFPAPLPLSLGRIAERVVSEDSPVKLLNQTDPILTSPNAITPADFSGWVEERGHSFMSTWDPGYTPLTETADEGQDPQRGGLLVAHPGKGTYIYVAYALYRQLPELVPGAYRLLANLLSAGAASSSR
ncbi:PIG-L family deacetylase [Occallatibacter riparius]|uniref:PIG-L family deacetylase n=1 Tax=Occallatibacter riparius TaxID=1002689 RepID=A0A9J7BM02_9BACT|nr:PIG-L family deacetylase [Occallatibacter riparius]UWZ83776.1 PIG-L family deacetylase [Occallatibacter riparius]